jgi:hypothetical protein
VRGQAEGRDHAQDVLHTLLAAREGVGPLVIDGSDAFNRREYAKCVEGVEAPSDELLHARRVRRAAVSRAELAT